jgi:hypothetical protein
MKRVFKTRQFVRWMRGTELIDAVLCRAIHEMEQGLIDADLGGGVIKKRIALPGRGKRGGARTLLATNKGDRWFFVFGFEQQEMENVSQEELRGLKEYARVLLAMVESSLSLNIRDGSLQEICRD